MVVLKSELVGLVLCYYRKRDVGLEKEAMEGEESSLTLYMRCWRVFYSCERLKVYIFTPQPKDSIAYGSPISATLDVNL